MNPARRLTERPTAGAIEWCEIGGCPTEQERDVLLAALELYLAKRAGRAPSAWTNVPREAGSPYTAPAWADPTWSGAPLRP